MNYLSWNFALLCPNQYIRCSIPSENKYISSDIQIIILPTKSQFVHFLLKRKGGLLYFNGHVTYDLTMTLKIIYSSKWHYEISKPELWAKKHISRIAGTVFIADYFFGGHFGNMQIC